MEKSVKQECQLVGGVELFCEGCDIHGKTNSLSTCQNICNSIREILDTLSDNTLKSEQHRFPAYYRYSDF